MRLYDLPDGRRLLVPFKEVDVLKYDQIKQAKQQSKVYAKHQDSDILIAVDTKTNDVLNDFREDRVGWDQKEWDTFETFIYPTLDKNFKLLKK
jgi:hypothetical protein